MKQIDDLKIIDPTKNDFLSLLNKSDLKELLNQIKDVILVYRDNLNLDDIVTFGLEIEYEGIYKSMVDFYINENYPKWSTDKDRSLESGGEIISDILYDNLRNWQDLKKICCFLKEKGANMDINAGGHIHVGAHILGNNPSNWLKFLKVYILYESILFKFAYGNKSLPRKNILFYAKPIAEELLSSIYSFQNSDQNYNLDKYLPIQKRDQAVSFKYVRFRDNRKLFGNTIEFRFPNGTKEEIIWQNNINALTKLVLSFQKDNFDEEYIDYKLRTREISSKNNFSFYNEINITNALELVDLIFDNNLDKIYFLKQYLKIPKDNKKFKVKRIIR